MKNLSLIFLFFIFIKISVSQNVGINTTGAAPAATNLLEVLSPSTTASSVAIYASHTGAITGTGYAIRASKTGASTTNIAGEFAASGATSNTAATFTTSGAHTTNTAASFASTGATNNYAIIVPASSGNVGIGTSSPTATNLLQVTNTSTTASSVAINASHSGAITGTGYAMRLSKTGASTTNVGGEFVATGATNNYAIIVPASSGNVGIGTSTPTATNLLEVTSASTTASSVAINAAHTGAITGTGYAMRISKTGASTTNIAGEFTASGATSNTAATFTTSGAHTTNTAASFASTGATNNYAIIVPASSGNVGIGTSTPSAKAILEMTSTSSGILIPRMTNAQRTSLAPGAAANQGLLIYQTDVGTTIPIGIGFYYWDGTAWTGVGSTTSGAASSAVNVSTTYQLFDEFMNVLPAIPTGNNYNLGTLGWYVGEFGADVTSSRGTYSNNHPGIWEINQPAWASNSSSIEIHNTIAGNQGNSTLEMMVKEGIVSGTAGNVDEYDKRVGFSDNLSSNTPTNGVFFRAVAGGAWTAVTRSGGSQTATSTGVAQSADTWRKFSIVINSAGTSIGFYIDGVLKATHTTNIPTVALDVGISTNSGASYASAGGYLYIDYFLLNVGISR